MSTYVKKQTPITAHQFDSTQPLSTYPDWLRKKFEACELEIVSGRQKYDSILGRHITLDIKSNEYFIISSEDLEDRLKSNDMSDTNDEIYLTWFVANGDYIAIDAWGNIQSYRQDSFELNYEKVGE